MTTTTNREEAERIAATRNIGVAEGPMTYIVVDGPGDGEYSVMTFADAEDAGFVSLCDGCRDGTPHGHMCDDSCDGCYRLRGVVGGCACADRGRRPLLLVPRSSDRRGSPRAGREGAAGRGREDHETGEGWTMSKAQMHLSVSEMGVPKYRINPGGGEMFAVLDLGQIQLFIFDPAELRRLADVAANAADVLEQAQAEARPASKCCDAAQHDRVRASDAIWATLEFVGYQDDGQGEKLELRNCPCGATLAILARESPSGADGAGAARVAG